MMAVSDGAGVKVALIQMSMQDEIDLNLNKSLDMLEQAAAKGAALIVFPELQLSPFFPQFPQQNADQYLLAIDDPRILQIQSKTKQLGVVVVPNIYLAEGDKKYDACPVIDNNGQVLGVSKMVHIVQIPQFYEQDYYAPSDKGFIVYDTAAGKVGVVICFDRHYPESIRACALAGAQIVVIPTAIMSGEPLEKFEWEVRLAAWQNNIFIAICNRVGLEGEMDFCGNSLVVDPEGDIIAQAGCEEEILFADADYGQIEKSRKARPYLALRRGDIF